MAKHNSNSGNILHAIGGLWTKCYLSNEHSLKEISYQFFCDHAVLISMRIRIIWAKTLHIMFASVRFPAWGLPNDTAIFHINIAWKRFYTSFSVITRFSLLWESEYFGLKRFTLCLPSFRFAAQYIRGISWFMRGGYHENIRDVQYIQIFDIHNFTE